MTDNGLIPLSGFFPARRFSLAGWVHHAGRSTIAAAARDRHFLPPRFFGYYFRGDLPVAIGGSWTDSLDPLPPVTLLPEAIEKFTQGEYAIVSHSRELFPDYLLVQDTRDGTCWLWTFAQGVKFIEAIEPVTAGESGWDDAEKPKLLGP